MLLEEYPKLGAVLTFLTLFGSLAIAGFITAGVLAIAYNRLVSFVTGNRHG
jgi:hypothetical protein